MMRLPITVDMTVQQIIEALLKEWPEHNDGIFQVALENDGKKMVVTVAMVVNGPLEKWPKDLLPSTGVPGQPRMQDLEGVKNDPI